MSAMSFISSPIFYTRSLTIDDCTSQVSVVYKLSFHVHQSVKRWMPFTTLHTILFVKMEKNAVEDAEMIRLTKR